MIKRIIKKLYNIFYKEECVCFSTQLLELSKENVKLKKELDRILEFNIHGVNISGAYRDFSKVLNDKEKVDFANFMRVFFEQEHSSYAFNTVLKKYIEFYLREVGTSEERSYAQWAIHVILNLEDMFKSFASSSDDVKDFDKYEII